MKKSTKLFKCSDPSQNVYGFSVITSGIQLDSFKKNPVCLLNHNYDKVLGVWEDVTIIGNTLQGVPVFDTEDPEANKFFGQVERDIIKGASIGIIPLSVSGDQVTSCELLEISITPVPANRNALVMYTTDGLALGEGDVKNYVLSITDRAISSKTSENISTLIEKGISNGTLSAVTRSKWVDLAEREPLVALSVLSALTESNISVLRSELTNLDNSALNLNNRHNWSFDDWSKNDSAGLSVMQDSNPELFSRLYQQKAREVMLMAQIAVD